MMHAVPASLCVVKVYFLARHVCNIRLLCPSGLEALSIA